eukprot:scaffold106141_cov69-Phaeocystis_antarctica.AAC.1
MAVFWDTLLVVAARTTGRTKQERGQSSERRACTALCVARPKSLCESHHTRHIRKRYGFIIY